MNVKPLINELLDAAANACHRYMMVFAGEPGWCYARAQESVDELKSADVLWIGQHAPAVVNTGTAARVQHFLGMEFQAVVFDAYHGFDPDLFAAISGTIKAGGLMILLGPPLNQWQTFDDPQKNRLTIWPYQRSDVGGRFLGLIARSLRQDAGAVVIEQHQPLPEWRKRISQTVTKESPQGSMNFPYRTQDQQQAVQAIMHVVSGHRHRPLVMTSDRGRGKSAALGIAAALLLKQGVRNILVTAPRCDAVVPVFDCAQALLPGAQCCKGELQWEAARLVFVAPDDLLRRDYDCNLLLVDEAAAIPVALLEQYLKRYTRIVFSTTIHGYEGTGRGFALRFQTKLNHHTPGWRSVALETPIRWTKHDPLESLVFKAFLLDASSAPDDVASQADEAECSFEKLNRDELVNDDRSLSQLFALLTLAHYQTQPADLRYLLDTPDVHIYVARYRQHIIAAALLEEEGVLDAALATGVYANKRRVRGHLLAQSMAAYVGLEDAPQAKYMRVMRIAVHPLAQQRGLGKRMLQHIETTLNPADYDLWGTSFGATPELLRFWRQSGFSPVHIGLSRNAASGMHAALLLKPLSVRGGALVQAARHKFNMHLPFMLAESYADLEPLLVEQLFDIDEYASMYVLSDQDRKDVQSFVDFARGYEVNAVAIWKSTCKCLHNKSCVGDLTQTELAMLITKVLQKMPWPEFVRKFGLNGQKTALRRLRLIVKKIHQYQAHNEKLV